MDDMVEIKNSGGRYFVSRDGYIYSNASGELLRMTPKKTKDGYLFTGLRVGGKSVWVRYHRVVAEAFIPNPHGYDTVNHKDGDKTNNRTDNLEWMDRHGQMLHAYQHSLKKPVSGAKNGNAKLTQEQADSIRAEYIRGSREHGTVAIGKRYGITNAAVGRIVRGEAYVG